MNAYRLMLTVGFAIALYLLCFAVAGADEVCSAPASIAEPSTLGLCGVAVLTCTVRALLSRFSARRFGSLLGRQSAQPRA